MSWSVSNLLERHKGSLSRDPNFVMVVSELVSKGIVSYSEEGHILAELDLDIRGEIFARIFSRKGFNAFRELCSVLEQRSPHFLTSLLLDTTVRMSLLNRSDNYRTYGQIRKCNSSIDYDRQRRAASIYSMPESQSIRSCHSRESSVVSLSRKYRDMDLNLPSQYSVVRSASSTPYSFLPPPPNLNSEEEALLSEHQHARGGPPLRMDSSRSASTNPSSYYGAGDELLEEPVEEQGGERIVWEYHQVILSRVPGYGFGIAVSGGRDNPHFTNGDASIAISDVLKSGPAEGKLLINDRVISANNISLENVDYATAVQVLRDSGQTVHLVVKRRVVLPPNTSSNESQSLRVSLSRRGKKEDFGVILGCRIYVKEIISGSSADKDGTLREGDYVHKINSTPLEGLSLKEARKLVESTKDKLDLILKRGDPLTSTQKKNIANLANGGYPVKGDFYNNTNHQLPEPEPPKNTYPAQNLYVQPPSRSTVYQQDEKNNLLRASQETHHFSNGSGLPPRPPPTDDVVEYGTSLHRTRIDEDKTALSERPPITSNSNNVNVNNNNNGTNANNLPYPRYISFQKAGSVGIRLTGGNDVGIFVTAVQPGSPASQKGLQPGDKILKVNDMDMKGVTREEAVLFLLSLQDTIDLIAQYRKEEYDSIVSLQRGDSFYIKAHFNYEIPEKNEMSFRKSDVFHVVDTLHNGVVGAWQVFKMDPFMSGLSRSSSSEQQVQKGVIPNKGRAEEIATQQFNAAKKEQNQSEQAKGNGGGSFFRRKREKSHRRSKSLGKRIKETLWSSTRESPAVLMETNTHHELRCKRGFSADRILQRKSRKCLSDIIVLSRDHWEDLVWSESMSKFPAYERVSLRHPGFPRPVVIFGPVADLARERLLRDYPSKFACPQDSSDDVSKNKSGIVRLSGIREIMDRRKHALLDVTPNAVDKLNYAQFYPIVIFVRADSKQTIKDCRTGVPKKAHLSSKKLFEQCQKLEKLWGHVFTGTLNLSNDNWYTKLTDLIDKQQTAPIWMSETKPDESFSDDFLFPMTSRLSYTSSPESDGEFCGDPETPKVNRAVPEVPHDGEDGRLTRSNSDSNLVSSNKESSDHHPLVGTINSANSSGNNNSNNNNANANTNTNGGIPNYNAPINCAIDSQVKSNNGTMKQHELNSNTVSKRDLYGGFRRTQVNESIDDLPLPPHPNHSSSSTSSSSPQNPSNANVKHGMNNIGGGPELPPKIDRLKKPSRRPTEESSSLDRNMHIRDMKMSAYDHNGGTIYDTYKSLDNEMVTQKSTSSLHHPHESSRHTRAISQDPNSTYRRQYSNGYDVAPKYNGNSQQQQPPVSSSNKSNGYDSKYRYADYKPVPPPKTASYKPIPPPKPKSYPRTQSQPPSIEGNYMNSGPYSNNYNNRQSSSTGYDDGDSNNTGFDSGHGSSLDRDYYGTTTNGNGVNTNNNNVNGGNSNNNNNANNVNNNASMGMMNGLSRQQHQYYYNIPNSNNSNANNSGSSPKRNGGDGLDLSNREYRGSAFELYKKPLSSCPPPPPTSQAANYFNGHTTIGR